MRLLPILCGLDQLPSTSTRQAVELGAAPVLRHTPFGDEIAFLLEFEELRIEGAVVDGQQVVARLFDATGDPVAVQRAQGTRTVALSSSHWVDPGRRNRSGYRLQSNRHDLLRTVQVPILRA